MCCEKPFLSWENLKKQFPRRFKDGKLIVYKALIDFGDYGISELRSPYFGNGPTWTPGVLHHSTRCIQKLNDLEKEQGVGHGFHTLFYHVKGLKNYLLDRCGKHIFPCLVSEDEFVICGTSNGCVDYLDVVTMSLTLGTTSYFYRRGNVYKYEWTGDKPKMVKSVKAWD